MLSTLALRRVIEKPRKVKENTNSYRLLVVFTFNSIKYSRWNRLVPAQMVLHYKHNDLFLALQGPVQIVRIVLRKFISSIIHFKHKGLTWIGHKFNVISLQNNFIFLARVCTCNTRSQWNFTNIFLTQEIPNFYHTSIIRARDIDGEMSVHCTHLVTESLTFKKIVKPQITLFNVSGYSCLLVKNPVSTHKNQSTITENLYQIIAACYMMAIRRKSVWRDFFSGFMTYISYTFEHVFDMTADGSHTCQLFSRCKPHIHSQLWLRNEFQFKSQMFKGSGQSSTSSFHCHSSAFYFNLNYKS